MRLSSVLNDAATRQASDQTSRRGLDRYSDLMVERVSPFSM